MAHPKTLDPVLDETRRLLLILQNEDGSWGFQENILDRALSTSWAIKTMQIYDEKDSVTNGVLFFQSILEKADYDITASFKDFARVNFLMGFFNAISLLLDSAILVRDKLISCILKLLEEIERREWLSSISLSSYVAYGLKDVKLFSKHHQAAINYIEEELKFLNQPITTVSPEVFLAMPNLLDELVTKENFLEDIEKSTNIRGTQILLGLALRNKDKNKQIITNIQEKVLDGLRLRQITELDRKITRDLLNLTLLLRSGYQGTSLAIKIDKLSDIVKVKESDSKLLTLNIEIPPLIERFGYLQLIALCSYSIAVHILKQDNVHLLTKKDYEKIQDFFIYDTIPVPRRREKIFETVTFSSLLILSFVILLGLSNMLVFLAKDFTFLELLKGNEWETALAICFVFWGSAIFKTQIRLYFPFLLGGLAEKLKRRK
ncbi:MAG: hypothetical protein ACTSQY_05380 [Candidatus Odinarchaeia archaeon]